MTETIEETTYVIDVAKLAWFKGELAKLNKVATKLGVPPFTVEEIERWEALDSDPRLGIGYSIERVRIRVEGETPKLPGGWEFVGAVEHLEAGNLLHGDDPVMSSYRNAEPSCFHCRLRRDRKKTVILRSEAGEVVQVGSACLKDFLGYHGNPDRIVRLLDILDELTGEIERDGWGGGGGGRDYGVPTDLFLAATAATVRANGWTAKSSGQPFYTALIVTHVLGLGGRLSKKHDQPLIDKIEAVKIEPVDEIEAAAVRAWVASIDPATKNDYLGNVRVALAGSYILPRHFGIGASAVSARRRDEEKAEQRAVETKKAKAPEFVGTIGQRIQERATVKFVGASEGDWGTTYMVTMDDEDGNRYFVFATGKFGYMAEKGDDVTFRGTVKKHEEFNGIKRTILTRVSAVEYHNQQQDEEK